MSRRADVVDGSWPPAADPEPSSSIGPASIMNETHWPFQSYIELGALPSAVPTARLHARFVMSEWDLGSIADTVELIVSELVTNGVKASQALTHRPPIWLGLCRDDHQVLVAVWDGSEEPIQASVVDDNQLADFEAEGGRGLLLVDSLSSDWGVHLPVDGYGKVVWAAVTAVETDGSQADVGHQSDLSLPKRMPAIDLVMQPVQGLSNLALLERVREGLSRLR